MKQLHGAGHLIGRPRITLTDAAPPVVPSKLPGDVQAALIQPRSERSEADRLRLATYVERERVMAELSQLPKPRLVYAAASDFEPDGALKPPPGPRPIHRLRRGDIRQKLEPALPGALELLDALPSRFDVPPEAHESTRRAALAKWIVDPKNPLTWRSIVNRTWQHHFGRGIVDSVNDFGRMGAKPTHAELLDWLAADFRDSGQSLKALHRRLVTTLLIDKHLRRRMHGVAANRCHAKIARSVSILTIACCGACTVRVWMLNRSAMQCCWPAMRSIGEWADERSTF